jgi:broad specificity phosphatase PhoE
MPGRAPGLHLSEQGQAEAARAAERVGALPAGTVSAVYASTLERAQETAAPIAGAVGLPVLDEPALVDSDPGEWTGQELKALYKLPEWRHLRHWPAGFRFPGGESFAELRARVASVVEGLVTRHPGAVVVAVTHADPIKLAVAEALGCPLDHLDRIAVSPASISVVAYSSAGVGVLAVNTLGGPLPAAPPPPARDGAGARSGARGSARAKAQVAAR